MDNKFRTPKIEVSGSRYNDRHQRVEITFTNTTKRLFISYRTFSSIVLANERIEDFIRAEKYRLHQLNVLKIKGEK